MAARSRSSGKTRGWNRSEEHTSELQSQSNLVCRLLLEKKKKQVTHDVPQVILLRRAARCDGGPALPELRSEDGSRALHSRTARTARRRALPGVALLRSR